MPVPIIPFGSFVGTLSFGLGKKDFLVLPPIGQRPIIYLLLPERFQVHISVWLLKLGFTYPWLQLYL